ncbi:MAG: hypothetical protein AB4368_16055 [Xenococcaceae cyanobacterium]
METIDLLAQKLIDTNSDQWFSKETFQAVEDYQFASLRYTDALVSTAYQSFADYWTWNAMFRVWLTGVTLGAFSLNRNLNKFAETGDKTYLNLCYEDVPYPGFISPDQKEFYSLFELAKESIFNSRSSKKEVKQCFEDICNQLQESNFLPPEFNISDPELKCPAKYDLATFFKVIQWGKKHSPETIKKNYFDFGPLPFIKALWTHRNKSHLLKL